jgi:antitoxin YefM
MQTTYRVHADELTDDFLQALKVAYKDREIEIIVSDDVDETDYLMSSPANRDHLLRAIENINNHKNLVEMSSDDL